MALVLKVTPKFAISAEVCSFSSRKVFSCILNIIFIDVNECAMADGICASGAECHNTFGGFECQRVCPKGYQPSADGECIDVDECSMGMDVCDPTTECFNTEGNML